MISYDSTQKGWHHIYNGILSPFATKYKGYIKTELKTRAQKEKETPPDNFRKILVSGKQAKYKSNVLSSNRVLSLQ